MIKHDDGNDELKIVFTTAIVVVALCVAGSIGGLAYKKYFGAANTNIDRDIFKNSKSYIEGMISDLNEHRRELLETTDDLERKAVIEYIDDKFSNFDESLISNSTLRDFLIDLRNGDVE